MHRNARKMNINDFTFKIMQKQMKNRIKMI